MFKNHSAIPKNIDLLKIEKYKECRQKRDFQSEQITMKTGPFKLDLLVNFYGEEKDPELEDKSIY